MWFFPLVFTGKEKDTETGYGYFGARYMDHELTTMWLSVDPMADKYPSISPYAYCAWNPVKLVDPDGCKIKLVMTNSEGKQIVVEINAIKDFPDDERMNILREMYKTDDGKKIIDEVMQNKNDFVILEKMDNPGDHEVSPDGEVSWGEPSEIHGGDAKNVLAEEIYHCYHIAVGNWKFDGSMTKDAQLDCEIHAKVFAAETFTDYNNYFYQSGNYIPTQMNIMRNESYEVKKSYLQKDRITPLPMYNYNPEYDVFNPQSTGKYYPHKGAY